MMDEARMAWEDMSLEVLVAVWRLTPILRARHYSKSAPFLCPKVVSYRGVANNFFSGLNLTSFFSEN